MEKVLHINWSIEGNKTDKVERYCHNCGKKVEFTDSLKRRQNANGKDIYHFAIYKCDQGHTWNMKIESFKAISGLENNSDGIKYRDMNSAEEYTSESGIREDSIREQGAPISIEEAFETLNIEALSHERVNITVRGRGKIRLDKLLSERLVGISRNDIKKHIESGNIRLGESICKYKQSIRDNDVISLNISAMRLDMVADSYDESKGREQLNTTGNELVDREVC